MSLVEKWSGTALRGEPGWAWLRQSDDPGDPPRDPHDLRHDPCHDLQCSSPVWRRGSPPAGEESGRPRGQRGRPANPTAAGLVGEGGSLMESF